MRDDEMKRQFDNLHDASASEQAERERLMEQERALDKELDRFVERVLETPPAYAISPDFAQRVAARVPTRPAVSVSRTYFGVGAVVVSLVALLVALLLLAAHASDEAGHPTLALSLQWLLAAQLIACMVWLGLRRRNVS